MKLTTEEVVKACGGILANGDMRIVFSGVSTDTRKLAPGELFVALKGLRFDGHEFVREAIDRGAKGLVISRFPQGFKLEECPKTVSIILVKDTLQALGELGRYVREREGFKAVGISGSCGKTTTKEMVSAVLSTKYRVAKNPGNYNNLIGLPLSLLTVPPGTEIGIFELGINIPGEMERLAAILKPEVSILTGIRPAHLEGLGDLQGVLAEKLKLFEGTRRDGVLVVNRDEEGIWEKVQDFPQNRITFGFHPEAEVRAEEVRVSAYGTEFRLRIRGKDEGVHRLRFLGAHFVKNALSALAVGLIFGVGLTEALAALAELSPLPGRLCPLRIGDRLVLDDSYNANPGSTAEALAVFSAVASGFSPRIIILGDMRELGREAQKYHEEMGYLAGKMADEVWTVGEWAEVMARAAEKEGAKVRSYPSTEALLEVLDIPSGAAVLVKGSRAVGLERVVESLKEGG